MSLVSSVVFRKTKSDKNARPPSTSRPTVIHTRPAHSCCRDIGTFTTIIDITSITAIIVNSSLIAFTSNTLLYYFPHMNEWDRVFYAVVCEHLLVRKTSARSHAVRNCCMRTFMRRSAQTQMHLAHCDTHTHTSPPPTHTHARTRTRA